MSVDPRLVAALREQLARRPAAARRLGWKISQGERERIGGKMAVGHLTYATQLEDGAVFRRGGEDLHADVEVAVVLGRDERIDGYAVALEIDDLADDGDAESIVARDVFQRAVAFGAISTTPPLGAEAVLIVNGERRAAGPVRDDGGANIAAVARVLGAAGERLEPGDVVITGLIANTPVVSGDEVVAEVGRDVTRWFSDASVLTRYGIATVNYGTSSGLPDAELGENLAIDGLHTAEVYARAAMKVCGVA